MPATVAPNGDGCAKASRGRPVPPAIRVVEAVVSEIAKLDDRAERLRRTVEFLEHIRRIGGQLESDLVKIVRDTYTADIPALREAASLAESLHTLKRETDA